MKKQFGYTLTELLMCGWILFLLCLLGGLIYAAVHFISKLW